MVEIGYGFLEKIFGSDAIRDRRNNCEPKLWRNHRKKNSAGTRSTTVKPERHQLLRPNADLFERQRGLKIGRK